MEEKKIYEIIDKAKSKKGSFSRLVYERPVTPSAKHKQLNIVKHVETGCRLGIDYSNMASVIERRAEAQPNAYVKTWEWVEGYEHFIKRNIKSGQLYVNFATMVNPNKSVSYTINGEPATEDDVKAVTPPSIWKDSRPVDTFDVKIENIIQIGGKD